MSGIVRAFKDYIYSYWSPGFSLRAEIPSSAPSVKRRTLELTDLPDEILEHIVEKYLSPKEQHTCKSILRNMKCYCACDPFCRLVSNQFTKVIYQHSIPQSGGDGNGCTAFSYDKNTRLVITGNQSDYSIHPPVNVFNAKGQLQLSAHEYSRFDKSVLAVKRVDGLVVAFGRREFGIWNGNNGTELKLGDNSFDLKMCSFSENERGVFVAGWESTVGYLDFMANDPWSTYHNLNGGTHTGRIDWIKEDSEAGFILTGCNNGIVNIWNHDHQFVRSIATGEVSGKYAYLPSKQRLFASLDGSSVGVWDTTNGELIQTLIASHELAVSSDGFKGLEWDETTECLYASWGFLREGDLHGRSLIWWDMESGNQLGQFLLKVPTSGLYAQANQIAVEKTNGDLILTGGCGMHLWNKSGDLLWESLKIGYLDRFEWDQEAKRIFILTSGAASSTQTLSMIDYNK